MFSSRLDSSRENPLKTWRKIWRSLIEACGSVASIPQVNSYYTSIQGHRDHIAEPSLGTFRNMKIRVWFHKQCIVEHTKENPALCLTLWFIFVCSLQNSTVCELKWTSATPQDWWTFCQTMRVFEQQSIKGSSSLNSTSHQPRTLICNPPTAFIISIAKLRNLSWKHLELSMVL